MLSISKHKVKKQLDSIVVVNVIQRQEGFTVEFLMCNGQTFFWCLEASPLRKFFSSVSQAGNSLYKIGVSTFNVKMNAVVPSR